MMKKMTIAALAAAAAFGLAACDNKAAAPSPCDHLGQSEKGSPKTQAQQLCEQYLHKSQDFSWWP